MRLFLAQVVLLFCISTSPFAVPATQEDIRAVREDIKQVIHYMDKRFEDMNRRFDMLMWFIGILTVLSSALISYMITRINRQDDKIERAAQHVDLSALLRDLRNADPAIKKGLKEILK